MKDINEALRALEVEMRKTTASRPGPPYFLEKVREHVLTEAEREQLARVFDAGLIGAATEVGAGRIIAQTAAGWLSAALPWSNTPQGEKYWRHVYMRLLALDPDITELCGRAGATEGEPENTEDEPTWDDDKNEGAVIADALAELFPKLWDKLGETKSSNVRAFAEEILSDIERAEAYGPGIALVFNPDTGARFTNPISPRDYRNLFPNSVWRYLPWIDGRERGSDDVLKDPFGYKLCENAAQYARHITNYGVTFAQLCEARCPKCGGAADGIHAGTRKFFCEIDITHRWPLPALVAPQAG